MSDKKYMSLALDLVKGTLGQTSPNPAVGAVVVKNGRIVGMGAHLKAGDAHAEVHALNMAGSEAEGATIYVTLEPCSHYGKTPPCAELIIQKKLARVVIATTDPNPFVSGQGIKKLEDAGLEVKVGVLQEESDHYNRAFFHFIKTKTPFVTMKMAVSLDGKMATNTGESKWITSEASRHDSHRLRHSHDAILIGAGTVVADDPALTTRLETPGKHPIRVVLDHHLRTPNEAKLINDKAAETWIVTTGEQRGSEKAKRFDALGVKVLYLDSHRIDISDVLKLLGEYGIVTLLVEGGPTIQDSFLRSKNIQQIVAYIAPLIIGGEKALSAFGGLGMNSLADALALDIDKVAEIGKDIKIIAHARSDEDVHGNH
ncbi:diaminohydroxyphosphoribosylaminopyrimidine deaminase [Scopulibacillus darangshiensis]|uniref:Riboflavin biosynthesis protein RibD n=1 Tax=Scopulibacillus darangshiensis TaxID=442528 RepID=A0A4R2P9K9_9BACL|nr:bifunctional diaminohydroxyphosphoribosylaminopyrimidine deaminase/5-amino-6-(5-phosphoribosylamino)uracil reductase RibD [Scopulibacillus darangshiensis]TCP31719.1 diaminohydroxyphosphoribosylaminopyrimidine deaminase [Scopulibacillus darangshiensis]